MDKMISVKTPLGTIEARIIPDDEYPGIGLVFAEPGTGEPGAIMEYDPARKSVRLRVWTAEDPDGDPAAIYTMATQDNISGLRLDRAVDVVCKNCLRDECGKCPVIDLRREKDSAGLTKNDKKNVEEELADALADILQGRHGRRAPRTIGEKIRFLREQKGWTQTELGLKAGMPDSQVGTYERGETKPRPGSLERIANALGVEVNYFM